MPGTVRGPFVQVAQWYQALKVYGLPAWQTSGNGAKSKTAVPHAQTQPELDEVQVLQSFQTVPCVGTAWSPESLARPSQYYTVTQRKM